MSAARGAMSMLLLGVLSALGVGATLASAQPALGAAAVAVAIGLAATATIALVVAGTPAAVSVGAVHARVRRAAAVPQPAPSHPDTAGRVRARAPGRGFVTA